MIVIVFRCSPGEGRVIRTGGGHPSKHYAYMFVHVIVPLTSY